LHHEFSFSLRDVELLLGDIVTLTSGERLEGGGLLFRADYVAA
jgi:hypothetical protein